MTDASSLGWATLVSLSLTAIAVLLTVRYLCGVWRESTRIQKEISRFPMFAARDALVHLVIDGKVADTETAWRATYEGVTSFLGMHRSLNVLDVARTMAKGTLRNFVDPDQRERANKIRESVKHLRRDNVDFENASRCVESAFLTIVSMRTSWVHHLTVKGYLLVLHWRLRIFPPTFVNASRTEARRYRREFREVIGTPPSTSEIAAFPRRRTRSLTAEC
jgi:hypothetical protein